MVVLDTNVISEAMREQASETVISWLDAQPESALLTTAITKAEILFGISILPDGVRKSSLWDGAMQMFEQEIDGRVLPFDEMAAEAYAEISAARRQIGRPIGQLDAQIAAIVKSRGLSLATRNTTDFEMCGIPIVDPWKRDG